MSRDRQNASVNWADCRAARRRYIVLKMMMYSPMANIAASMIITTLTIQCAWSNRAAMSVMESDPDAGPEGAENAKPNARNAMSPSGLTRGIEAGQMAVPSPGFAT